MNPIKFAVRRPVTALMLLVALVGGGVFALYKMRVDVPALHTAKIYAHLDYIALRAEGVKRPVVARFESYFHARGEQPHHEHHKIVVTTPQEKAVVITQPYVCQIRAQRHINVCALEGGYLKEILVKEGQRVKKGDLLFKIVPILFQAKLDAEVAERDLAQLEFDYTRKLSEQKVVSKNEVALLGAKLAKAQAKAQLAGAELNFTNVTAPFDGIVDRLREREGSLIKEGDVLTTLSDNSVMWVYFNVPEAQYLEYMAGLDQQKDGQPFELKPTDGGRLEQAGKVGADEAKFNQDHQIDLMLANGDLFKQVGKIGAIEAKFNNETGNIPFRADFPNPYRLLRHGQTGTVLVHRMLKGAVVIPQRATFEILDKRYAYVLDKDGVAHQREIAIQNQPGMDDIFIIKKGLNVNDRIVLEGVREVRDGEKLEYEFRQPEPVMASLKNRAE